MSRENVLQSNSSPLSLGWQARERSLWCETVRRPLFKSLLLCCSLRLFSQWNTPTEGRSQTLIILCLAALAYCGYIWMDARRGGVVEEVKTIVMLHVTQAYFVLVAVNIYPNDKEWWVIASSLLFAFCEIPSFQRTEVALVLLARQFFMWYCACGLSQNEREGSSFSLLLMFLSAMSLVYFLHDMKERAMETFRFVCSLEDQDRNIKDILQAIPEGLAVVTSNLHVPCSNTRIQQILRPASSQRELIMKLKSTHCFSHISGENRVKEGILGQVETFLQVSDAPSTTFGVTCDAEKYYEWKGTKCVWGKAEACIVTATEITSWAVSRQKLVEESEAKTALLRFVSHELRTPTNAILNLTSNVMTGSNIHPEQRVELSIVVTSTYFLLSVVNDLLDFTRIVADKFTLIKQAFDIRKEIRDTVSLVELQCAHKGLFLKVNIDDLIPDVIYTDPNRLKQVLLNLLGNALKFTFHGGIRVICHLTEQSTVRVAVNDTGIGIHEEKIAGLCQAFGTVEGTQRINPQGCGLGLYISSLLALSLGSKPIEIQSKVGVGSEFSFHVQIYQTNPTVELTGVMDTTTDINEERDFESPVSRPGFIGLTGHYQQSHPPILIVDDSEFNRVVLVKMLEVLRVRADEASTGLKAVAMIRNNMHAGRCYKLILMDMEMPEMDGVTATQEIRTLELTGELGERPKIVGCSAHRGREDAEKCLVAGMDDYLEKPICKDRLRDLITEMKIASV